MPCKRNREHTLGTRGKLGGAASGLVSLSDDAFPHLKSPRSTPHRRWLSATGRLQTSRARTRSAAVACPLKPVAASINPRATATTAPIRNMLQCSLLRLLLGATKQFRGERELRRNGSDPVRWLCADRARACERRVSGRRRAARRPSHTLHPEVLALLPLRAACGRT